MPLKRFVSIGLAIAFVLPPSTARADDETARCIASYERGQVKRKEQKLIEARADFEACSREACPDLARRDCVVWLREVDAAIPSIVVAARTASGADIRDAALFLDARRVQETLSGSAVDVEPGEHIVRVATADGRAAETSVIAVLGEKNRLVRLTIAEPPKRVAEAPVAAASPWPVVLGGVALVAIAAGVTLDLVGSGDLRALRNGCAPGCDASEVDATRTKIILGDALVGVGIVTGAVAIYLALSGRTSKVAAAW